MTSTGKDWAGCICNGHAHFGVHEDLLKPFCESAVVHLYGMLCWGISISGTKETEQTDQEDIPGAHLNSGDGG